MCYTMCISIYYYSYYHSMKYFKFILILALVLLSGSIIYADQSCPTGQHWTSSLNRCAYDSAPATPLPSLTDIGGGLFYNTVSGVYQNASGTITGNSQVEVQRTINAQNPNSTNIGTCTGELMTSIVDAQACADKATDQGTARGYKMSCSVTSVGLGGFTDPNTNLDHYYNAVCTVNDRPGHGAYTLVGFDAAPKCTDAQMQKVNQSGSVATFRTLGCSNAIVDHVNPGWSILAEELKYPYKPNRCMVQCQGPRSTDPTVTAPICWGACDAPATIPKIGSSFSGGTSGYDPYKPADVLSGSQTVNIGGSSITVETVDPEKVAAEQRKTADYAKNLISTNVNSMISAFRATTAYFIKDYQNRIAAYSRDNGSTITATPERVPASAPTCTGGLTASEKQTFTDYFANGQHQSSIPSSFNLNSAFAYSLGLGNTGTSKVGSDKMTYINQNGQWVMQGQRPSGSIPAITIKYPGNAEKPPAYLYAMENCGALDGACIANNSARQQANLVLISNARNRYNRDMCEYNYSLNPVSILGSTNTCGFYVQSPVPIATGVLQVPIVTGGQVLAPVLGQTAVVCTSISQCPSDVTLAAEPMGPSQAVQSVIAKARITPWNCTSSTVTATPERMPVPTNSCPQLTYDQFIGAIGSQVMILTDFLTKQGFMSQSTNMFDTSVERAVVAFQEANADAILLPFNLTKGTGIVGTYTRKFINPQLTCTNGMISGNINIASLIIKSTTTAFGDLSADEQQAFTQYFGNGANVGDIPTQFNLDSAFAYTLGLGNTGTNKVGYNGVTYVNRGRWVKTAQTLGDATTLTYPYPIENCNPADTSINRYICPVRNSFFQQVNMIISSLITKATTTTFGDLNSDEQQFFINTFSNGANQSYIPSQFNLDSAFAYMLSLGNGSDTSIGSTKLGSNGITYVNRGRWVKQ